MQNLDISELAKHSGVPASTLRYYEEIGLIRAVGRKGIKRVFTADVMDRLTLIGLGRRAGFKLREIAALMGQRGTPRLSPDALRGRADALDQQIAELQRMRDGLKHAANCTAPSHLECPKFRRILKIAEGRRRQGKP